MSDPQLPDWDALSDDELMAVLAEAVAAERDVPDNRRDAARAAFTWRTVDAELAELLHDSALEAGAAVRSTATAPRTLSFAHAGLTVEVEVDGDDLLVEVVGEPGATVVLQPPDADEVAVVTDAAGFARFDAVAGTVRFVVTAGEASLTTPWVTL